jgi:hypothetical protein
MHSLSIVIPVERGSSRLESLLSSIRDEALRRGARWEVVLARSGTAADGYGIPALVDSFNGAGLRVRSLGVGASGQGACVRRGMLAANGSLRLALDVSGAFPIGQIDTLLTVAEDGADVVIGSRFAPDAARIGGAAPLRTLRRRVRRAMRQAMILPGVGDAGSPCMLFTRDAAESIFRIAHEASAAWRWEALSLAKATGFRMREVGVVWDASVDDAAHVGLIAGLLSARRIGRRIESLRREWGTALGEMASRAAEERRRPARGTREGDEKRGEVVLAGQRAGVGVTDLGG